MRSNLYQVLLDLIQDPSLQVGTVASVADQVATVTLPDGGALLARGAATVGQKVFVRGGVIEGQAPNLPVEIIEV